MTARKLGQSYRLRLPSKHAARLEQWAVDKGITTDRLAALLLCLAIEQWEGNGKIHGAKSDLDGAKLDGWLARREHDNRYGGGTELDDGIPF